MRSSAFSPLSISDSPGSMVYVRCSQSGDCFTCVLDGAVDGLGCVAPTIMRTMTTATPMNVRRCQRDHRLHHARIAPEQVGLLLPLRFRLPRSDRLRRL